MIGQTIEKIKKHSGEFMCEPIGAEGKSKIVSFRHIVEPPVAGADAPEVGDLKEFYSLVGELTLYFCEESEEAAFFIAPPDQWEEMEEGLTDWVDMLDEGEEEEALPEWFGSHQVIGEIPSSGNCIIIVTDGKESGSIYQFDHDGFEFRKVGRSISDFVEKAIDPDEPFFTEMASHMRFISGSTAQQWWARELRHKHGKVIRNED